MNAVVRAATRASELARRQTQMVADLLAASCGISTTPVAVSTIGDRRQDTPIQAMGGKGVFVSEVQAAVIDGRADIAVHSAKDLPAVTPPGLTLAAVPERGDPRDALVGCALNNLHEGSTVATGSIRRRVQLAALRPGLAFSELRGNIATRLAKAAGFDAIVVAAAALERLELSPPVVDVLEPDVFVPQVGQGALAVECRSDNPEVLELLTAIEHPPSRRAVDTERAFLAELGGDCNMPAGAYAVVADEGEIHLSGLLASQSGATLLRTSRRGHDPDALGRDVARQLLAEAR